MKYHKQLLAVIYMLLAFVANAQKLPSVQQTSLRAPANFKIDGKAFELNDTFEAYNHATSLFYTISNDDDNLYLIIQATDPAIVKKIIRQGIVFTVKSSLKGNNGSIQSISYPWKPAISPNLIGNLNKKLDISSDPIINKKQTDSLISTMNLVVDQQFKEIKLTGISAIKDTLISEYNDTGIKVIVRFNDKRAYNYLLAVPLKYLNILADSVSEFNYNIKVEGIMENRTNIVFTQESDYMRAVNYTTDFWGKYILAGK